MERLSHLRPLPHLRLGRFSSVLAAAALLTLPCASAAIVIDLDPASPSGGTDLNAFSYGGGPFVSSNRVSFSVDRVAIGRPGTGVFRQARPGTEEAHGDVFHTSPRGNHESIDEERLGLIPGFFGDDIDALELRDPTTHSYFSIDFLSPSNNFGATEFANDIFLNNLTMSFASGELDIGLSAGDDIDALHLYDTGVLGGLDAGLDYAIFSLSTFSTTVLGGGAGPGDLLFTNFDGSFSLWKSAADLGLAPGDELNAVSIPEPSSFLLLVLAGSSLTLLRRRSQA